MKTEPPIKDRGFCRQCRQPIFGCFCSQLKPFDPQMTFVILIHPIEVKRRIATGRMSHLMLKGSYLIEGQDFTNNSKVNALIADQRYEPFVLYPGATSNDLCKFVPSSKKPLIFVIDGTWATARKTMRQSLNLHRLPRYCFLPTEPSRFRVRKQPAINCVSTIEAIYQSIEVLSPVLGCSIEKREYAGLLRVFDSMVEEQLKHVSRAVPRA